MKKVIIVHGWDGYPEEGWFPWLKKKLEAKGFAVAVPQLPDAGSPHIDKWVPALRKSVGVPDEETYFVGHSMGCQTIARYLEPLTRGVKIGGVVFVAGFFKRLTNLEYDAEVRAIVKEWFEAPIDFEKIRSHIAQSVAIFSDDDPYVPLDSQDDFRDKLDSAIIIEHSKGHFSGPRDHIIELPIVLEKVLEIAK